MHELEVVSMQLEKLFVNAGICITVCGGVRRNDFVSPGIVAVLWSGDSFGTMAEICIKTEKNLKLPKNCVATTPVSGLKNGASFKIVFDQVQCSLYATDSSGYGAALLEFTGSSYFNIALRSVALKQYCRLNRYGLWLNDERLAGVSEYQIFNALGVQYVPPECRSIRHGCNLDNIIIKL